MHVDLVTDVLVIGGGPAASWAAIEAAHAGARVALVDKGYLGTSGAAAPTGVGTWWAPTKEGRRATVERRVARSFGLADVPWAVRTLDEAHTGLERLAAWGYPFPNDDSGERYIPNLRTADYMHFMRRRVRAAGVSIYDHHPALELIVADGVVCGALGIARQSDETWRIRAAAVVLATGGCVFGERVQGAAGLTGDGYLMAVEAGATLSGMEFSSQYGIVPFQTASNKGLIYFWATFMRVDGTPIEDNGEDRQVLVARALSDGPVYARFDNVPPALQNDLRAGQPNILLPFDRAGINPFEERFPVMLRCEGTVRGVGGIRLAGTSCATGVPGLFAAGDAASRERLTGAISGGGGPNSAWAIASGRWAGRSAGAFARYVGRHHETRAAHSAGRTRLDPTATGVVKAEMLPLDRNFFRTGRTLRRSLTTLGDAWTNLRSSDGLDGVAALRAREAAAMTATARWSYTAALHRTESRGMHRRLDAPAMDPAFARPIAISGLDTMHVERNVLPAAEALAS
jgi:succinate dehydrogenase/fumarate reductase flavoprotein subunit